jgi:hypothetical protein
MVKKEVLIAAALGIPIVGVILYFALVKAGVLPPPTAAGAAPSAAPAVIMSDDFDDNTYDPAKWDKISYLTNTLAETNQRLECTVGSDYADAGYQTKQQYDLTDCTIEVETQITSALGGTIKCRNGLCIHDTKILAENPFSKSANAYEFHYVSETQALEFDRNLGGVITSQKSQVLTPQPYAIKMVLSGGTISAYYQTTKGGAWTLFYSETFALPSKTLYVSIWLTAGSPYGGTGSAWFDNFSIHK